MYKSEFRKRFEAFAWNAGWVLLVLALDFAASSLELFNLPNGVSVTLGMLLTQVSKAVRNRISVTY